LYTVAKANETVYLFKEPLNNIGDFVHPTLICGVILWKRAVYVFVEPEVIKTHFTTALHYYNTHSCMIMQKRLVIDRKYPGFRLTARHFIIKWYLLDRVDAKNERKYAKTVWLRVGPQWPFNKTEKKYIAVTQNIP